MRSAGSRRGHGPSSTAARAAATARSTSAGPAAGGAGDDLLGVRRDDLDAAVAGARRDPLAPDVQAAFVPRRSSGLLLAALRLTLHSDKKTFSALSVTEELDAHRGDDRPGAGPLRHQGRPPRADARWAEEAGLCASVWIPADPRRVRRPHRGRPRRAPTTWTRRSPTSSTTGRHGPSSRIEIGTAVVPSSPGTHRPRPAGAVGPGRVRRPPVARPRRVAPLGHRRDARPALRAARPHHARPPRRARPGPGRARARSTSRTSCSGCTTPSTSPTSTPTPVLLAALGPLMLRLAGERTDGTILWLADERAIATHVAPRITQAAEAAGRPAPRIVAGIPVCLCRDDEVDAAVDAHQPHPVRGGGVAQLPAPARPRRRPQRRRHPGRRQRDRHREAPAGLRRRRRHRRLGPGRADRRRPRRAAGVHAPHPRPPRPRSPASL